MLALKIHTHRMLTLLNYYRLTKRLVCNWKSSWQWQMMRTSTGHCCSTTDATTGCMTHKRKLQPRWRRFKFLEQIWEWYAHNKTILSDHISMHHKVFHRHGTKHQVHIATSQTKRLCWRLWQLNVIACRNSSSDFVHSCFECSIL